jgi:dTDP-4-amino-4,6-dideoxy-D-galactose acyltransferase
VNTSERFNTVVPLDWDSAFFGYPVARVVLDETGSEHFKAIADKILKDKIRLVYFFLSPSDLLLNRQISEFGAVLRDQKTLFSKVPESQSGYSSSIEVYPYAEPDKELLSLGLQAGIFSRFRLDGNFKNNEYERLYTRWVTDSLSGKISFQTIVAMVDNTVAGMVTLGEKNGHADIGLVSVARAQAGKGIGYDMIRYADNTAYNRNFSRIEVVTQLQNHPACRLYEKCNFKLESVTNVYHFWQ